MREHSEPQLFVLGEGQQIVIALRPDDTLIGDIGECLHEDGCLAELGFSV